jgi:phthiocerol/phenolphthiocerol synthesis type-I polyketide synthase E
MKHEETDMSDAEAQGNGTGLEIAVIGMAGRFPGADDIGEFWRNLRDGVESLTVLSEEEQAAVPPAMRRSPSYVPVARMIPNYDCFDAAFFGVNPREADVMDPQQRLFLECAWSALEHSGYDPERYPGPVGIYAGSRMNFYLWNVYSNPVVVGAVGDLAAQIANEKDYLATRVSYKLNLGGPSVSVQSACSTSLVAVHMACQGLLSGECDMAMAGGISIRIPEIGYVSTDADVNSPDGHVRSFDAKAAGTVFSSGMGIVVLKRLADALADGDTIHAVIKGSAVTNDGSQKVGFTAPGVDGQVRVIRTAMTVAEVEPGQISYVEAHGTGTPVGDPIEITALTKVFREKTEERGFCALGTVKTNIGHLGAAAGVAGLIKTVLALEHRMIPPSLLFEEPNPQIDFESSPFFVNTRLREWPVNGQPRRAGVSAFGMGGTNAHVIVEEAPEPAPAGPSRPWQLLLLSARTETALATVTANLAAHLEAHLETDLADAAWTLQVGRKVHEHRRTAVCRDAAHAREVLAGLDAEWVSTAFSPSRERAVAFLFTGQGAQYAGMGKGLYESEATFREQVGACCERLRPLLGLDLRDLLFAASEDAAGQLGQTRFTQPALFVVEYALARLLMEWGLTPKAMLGHSVGEYAAACLAGVMSLDDALLLVAERGRLIQGLPSGAMLAVPLSEEQVLPLLGAQLSLAAVNAPSRCVVSGPHEAVEALHAELSARGVAARPLHTSHAFHSGMMEPILEPFIQLLSGMELHAPQIPYVSNVTGTWITELEATDPGYWARHLRQAVRFADGVQELAKDPQLVLLEVGPGQTLAALARQHPSGKGRVVLSSVRHPKSREADLPVLLKTLGQLWLAGVQVDWHGFHAREQRRRVPLPTYPFERSRFWIEAGEAGAAFGALGQGAEAQKKEDLADWFYLPYWKPSLPPAATPGAEEPGRWLVFLDPAGVGERVAARLLGEGRTVSTVLPGESFRDDGNGHYEVRAGQREDYDALIRELISAGRLPDRVLHLWNVGPVASSAEALEAAPALSFWSLLCLAQALGRNNGTQPVRMAVVSSHMQNVAGEERLLAERALLLGPVKTIPQEYTNVSCVSVDVELPFTDAMVDRLIREAEPSPSVVVAYRNGRRWAQSYEAVRLEEVAGRSALLREGGVYLITGGLGGLGLTFAEFLAREFRARLVLLGVSALPERESWDVWLRTHGEMDRISQRLRKLQELEALGAEVLVVSADVTDREQVRTVVNQALERFGELNGVIHAAGLAGGGMIQLKTAEVAARVLSPKVAGTRSLLAALDGIPVDFLALCSSTIAVAGGLGQVDYCAANNFLDALAHEVTLAGGPRTVSINWGAWEEVGMAVAAGLTSGRTFQPQSGKAAEDIHPLLDRCIWEMADQTVYATDFSASRHWVLAEHRILQTPTLPGTTYLELARAAFLHHAAAFEGYAPDGGVEVRDVFFLSPLLLPEGEREVRVFLEKDGDSFNFRVASRMEPPSGQGEPSWKPHARGKVLALGEGPVQDGCDIEEIRERCRDRVMEITGPVMSEGDGLVYWGAHWQSLKRILLGSEEALAEIELPEDLAAEVLRYGLHPALLDVATGMAGFFEQDSYLPLSYQRVKIHRPLPPRFFSHLRKHPGAGTGGETLAVDVTILDEAGEVLVEIDHFTMKRVGETASFQAVSQEVARPEPAAQPAAPAGVEVSGGILPHEGVEALRRILSRDLDAPQIVATAKDLHALIAQVSAVNRSSILSAGAGAAPQAIHARPNIPTPYRAPSTEAERRLAEIWQASLGIDQVGIDDNFFDLGGDSILGIQLVSRTIEAGMQLSPDQLFEHQTIAELAKVLSPAMNEEAVPAWTAGNFPDADLSPEDLEKLFGKLEGVS